MGNKQQKKIRQLVRRNQNTLAVQSWDVFFATVSQLKLRYRIKLAWKIIKGVNIRKEEKEKNGTGNTRN